MRTTCPHGSYIVHKLLIPQKAANQEAKVSNNNNKTMEEITRQLETAKSKYNDVDFKTDVFFNEKPPDPIVAFVIGGVSPILCQKSVLNVLASFGY